MNVTVEGVELHYEVHGEGDPILLVHGFPLSGALWDGVVERLADRWRLIVPDLRGHGRSEASAETTMRRYADDLVAVLDAAGEKRPVVLVGLSMGGYVAFEFYRRHPERVRALVLANTRATRDAPEVLRGRHDSAERALREGSAAVSEGMVDRLFAPTTPPELRERWREIMAATPPAGVAAALRAMAERTDSRRLLKRVGVPVLVIVGSDDVITPANEARAMAEAAKWGRIRMISRAGHMTPVEQPGDFAAALEDFLRTL